MKYEDIFGRALDCRPSVTWNREKLSAGKEVANSKFLISAWTIKAREIKTGWTIV